jgi:hypothetical protein
MRWEPHVKPVFDAAYRLLGDDIEISGEDLEAAVREVDPTADVYRAVQRLRDHDLIDPYLAGGMRVGSVRATALGEELAHGWPRPDAVDYDLLLDVLRDRIDDPATGEDERGRLRRWLDVVGQAGETVGTEVLAAYLAKVTGAG